MTTSLTTKFMNIVNSQIDKCEETRNLETSIKGFINYCFKKGDSLESLIDITKDHFNDPSIFDVGQSCSDSMMGAIQDFTDSNSGDL
jgi:hypothetical protein